MHSYFKELMQREKIFKSFHASTLIKFYENAPKKNFLGQDKVRLQSYLFHAENEAAVIILVPGRTESIYKYAEFIFDLNALGISVYTYDHRGQGESERIAKDSHIGHVNEFQDYVDDFMIFCETIVRPLNKKSLFVLAHSMGGAVAAKFLLNKSLPLKGVCFSAPMFEINFGKLPPQMAYAMVTFGKALGRGQAYAPSTGPIEINSYGFDLSSSVERVHQMRKMFETKPEFAIGGPSNNWLKTSIEATKEIVNHEAWSRWSYPTLLLDAGSDQVVLRSAYKILTKIDAPLYQTLLPRSEHEIFFEKDVFRVIGLQSLYHFVMDNR